MSILSFLKKKYRFGANILQSKSKLYRLGDLICEIEIPLGFHEGISNKKYLQNKIEFDVLNNELNSFKHEYYILIDFLDWQYHTLFPYPMGYSFLGKLIFNLKLVPYVDNAKKHRVLEDIKQDIEHRYNKFYHADNYDPDTGRGYNKHQLRQIHEQYNESSVANEDVRNAFIQEEIDLSLVKTSDTKISTHYVKYESARNLTSLKNHYCFLFNNDYYLVIDFTHDGWNDSYMALCLDDALRAEEIVISSFHLTDYLEQGA
ncbi:hypothetical protein [Vibrio vulnificus]|uniref:hypothetical protein n=1 Tax=Vibrio vulnificus TaxID=672 RepID=UPI000CD0DCB6|nr:hypothetical protein [Vibrio vulnificus]EHU4975833.1 hypothetical protein [Vibrio vulnificus]MCU8444803.1 hypothetical protein [Vibrio vulnificus]POC39701.1 hypothetical protein CRN38_04130 [Vibrio vulnificus]POC55630.1 hypothetical protein CRN37_16485 [Vibrio vulnificus]POC71907.1 hypothetical protein CRN34_16495 [Vibrio vulnificus]